MIKLVNDIISIVGKINSRFQRESRRKKKQSRDIPLQGDWPITVGRYFNSNRSIGKRRCERIFIIHNS